MNTVDFYLKLDADVDAVWEQLAYYGCELLYSNESDDEKLIVGRLPKTIQRQQLLEYIPELQAVKDSSLPAIDWEQQWAVHGMGYREGYVHVDLSDYAPAHILLSPLQIKLKAGPGFGDLSHPTTRLVLRLMAPLVAKKHVIDIGSGSGILSLAACALKARIVEGIDIDSEAIQHACENSALNEMETRISFMLPEEYEVEECDYPEIVLMNMIQSEQKQAWDSLPMLHGIGDMKVITSGILVEGRETYLKQAASWGWSLVKDMEEEEWLAFIFDVKKQ